MNDAVQIAAAELRNHPLRTILTLSGVLVAIATVVAVGAMLDSVRTLMRRVMYENGALTSITIAYQRDTYNQRRRMFDPPNPLTPDDSAAIREDLVKGIDAASAVLSISSNIARGVHSVPAHILAVEPSYFRVAMLPLDKGRYITTEDEVSAAAVILIDVRSAERLFGSLNVVGQDVSVNGVRLRIVGLLAANPSLAGRQVEAFVPLTSAFLRLYGAAAQRESVLIVAKVKDGVPLASVSRSIARIVEARHPQYDPEYFVVRTSEEAVRRVDLILLVAAVVFAIVAGLCLLTGGVGIMNIQLSSVSERTREVGLRRAVGARRKDIYRQFLSECVALATLGCAGGTALGYLLGSALSVLLNRMMHLSGSYSVHPSFNPLLIIVAVVTSSLVAIVFGSYPAKVASTIDPADALRHE